MKLAWIRTAKKTIHAYLLKCLINNVWLLKMIIHYEVESIQEISDIYTAHWVHLGEW